MRKTSKIKVVLDTNVLLVALPPRSPYRPIFDKLVVPYFRWQLIVSDPDDDKFVDVAISANVDYLVTNDKHFNILKTLDFPKVTICKAQEFKSIVLGA